MMPLALGMLWVELWLLGRLLIVRPVESRMPIPLVVPEATGSGQRRVERVLHGVREP
jgi:hypothetical protein